MKIFVINLEKDIDRKRHIIQQLNSLKLDYEIIEGVYAKELDSESISSLYSKNKALEELGRELKTGEIGCALSHFKIFKRMTNKHIQSAIILEDDISIQPGFSTIINKLGTSKYEYISFNYTVFSIKNIKLFLDNIMKEKKILNIIKKMFLLFPAIIIDIFYETKGRLKGSGIGKRFKPLYFTGGYYITYEGAKKLLSIHDKVFLPADILPEKYRKRIGLKMGFVYPLLIQQLSKFGSNVQKLD